MMKVPFAKPVIDQEMIDAAVHALQNEKLVMGESVYKFEEEFAKYVGTKRAVSLSSGTDALRIALETLDIRGHTSTVALTTNSFIATANVVSHNNARPHFIDIDPKTGLMDNSFKCVKYDAIIPVHIYGNPVNMDEILEDASRNGAHVIEDACQAHGASFKNRKTGSMGTVGCFSFYTTKNMTVGGDGGMVTLNDETLADKIASLRDCGRKSGQRYEHDLIGYTNRLNTVNAAIGRVQLKRLDSWNESRRRAAKLYRANLPDEVLLDETMDGRHVYHLFVIRTRNRDFVASHLKSKGIDSLIHYPIPIHKQPVYDNGLSLEKSEMFAREILSLPIYPEIKDDEVRYVCDSVNEALA